jgi:RHO1 GDP-GTP exchange protein 1/2
LGRFQDGNLNDLDEEWNRLVPNEAREALGKQEVRRQSVIFEVIKSERNYVADLEAVREVIATLKHLNECVWSYHQVFIEPLRNADPSVIPPNSLPDFISEVFYNIDGILAHEKRMLAALFLRQREQHPIVQSVADIILESKVLMSMSLSHLITRLATLRFAKEYESYIEHYPISESRHRKELGRNPRYQDFLQQCSLNPRIRKRDIVTFLSRPVTRLPRLILILEQINKFTDADQPDKETLPLVLSILSDFVKGTQRGITAAENKVKFWDLCESLVYVKGEIIVRSFCYCSDLILILDMYDL